MGLDFTYKKIGNKETAHWGYGGFNRFREKIAEGCGIELNKMVGFCPNFMNLDQAKEFNKTAISWNTVKSPIKYFLYHSDCDGQISAKRCGVIAPIIRKIINKWSDDDYDKQQGKILVKNMLNCYKNNTPLIFT